MRFWVRFGLIAGGICALIAAAIFYDNTVNPRSVFRRIWQSRDPVYQWMESDNRSFDFLPGEGKAWGPIDPQQGEVRYNIKSSLPVETGLMETKWADRVDAWISMPSKSTCFESGVRKAAKDCHMKSGRPQLIFIRDLRPKQAGLTIEKAFGTKGAMQEPNNVIITIFKRQCMENCKYALE